jgi:hypothetical protein
MVFFFRSKTIIFKIPLVLELRQLVKALENNAFFEEVIEIQVGDKVESVKIHLDSSFGSSQMIYIDHWSAAFGLPINQQYSCMWSNF